MIQPTAAAELLPKAPALAELPRAQEDTFSQVMARQEDQHARAELRHEDTRAQQHRHRADQEQAEAAEATQEIQPRKKNVSKLDATPDQAEPDAEDPVALVGAVAQQIQEAVASTGEVPALAPGQKPLDVALPQPPTQLLSPLVAGKEAAGAEPFQQIRLPHGGLPDGALISWEVQPGGVPADTAALEASTWQVWAARLQNQHQAQPPALPLDLADEAMQALPQGVNPALQAPTGQAPAPMILGGAAQQGGQPQSQSQNRDGSPQGQGFEVAAAAADVQGGAKAAQAAPGSRAGAVTQAIRESLQLRAQEGGGHQARLEVQVGEDRLIIQVRVRGGQVDVDVRGMDAAELARLREELAPELSRQRLALGELRQDDTAGASAQDQGAGHQGERQEAHQSEGIVASPRPARQQGSGGQRGAQAQEPGLHLEA